MKKLILLLLIPILSVGQIIKEGSRQIHLDFHTSGLIENIGENFSKEQFKKALKIGDKLAVSGKVEFYNGYQIIHPDFEKLKDKFANPSGVAGTTLKIAL